ncbi:Ig-like domain repeat protein [Methanobrevibacter gottschalkii]|uniref:Ig-like domain repeat protein n=2 Tax=Methanobrevibacter gottschalkii TaxID=190974 RepID=UPI0026F01534|nr:Ig-like domain repeat protein [Methanobrevibacter gottschalkii]
MILSISAVSAADMDLDPELALPKSDVGIGASDGEVLADDGSGDFTSLQNSIDDDGSTLILTSDYKRVDGDSDVSITKDVTIIGNNHKIDADKKGGIFKVNTGCTLTLIGVTLINGNNEKGGAIYNDGGVLNIVNSQLINNTAVTRGGAIYSEGNVAVNKAIFDGNDVTFRSKNVDNGGAAIYALGGKLTVVDSNFTNNLKDYVVRGTDDKIGDLINAIITTSAVTEITGSRFVNNSGCYGGAIYAAVIDKVGTPSLVIRDSEFVNNTAYAGTIQIADIEYEISDSVFDGNKALGYGSVGYTAAGAAVTAMYSGANGLVTNCTFTNNRVSSTATPKGGAIVAQNGKIHIAGSKFENNSVFGSELTYGGAICGDSSVEMIIENSNFTNNTAAKGGAIYSDGKSLSVSNSNFKDNNGIGTIYNNAELTLAENKIQSTNIGIINDKGTVTTTINAIFLENKTLSAELGDVVELRATLTDDNGNAIKDYNFKFSVNGKTIEDITFDDGVYTTEYIIENVGEIVISTDYVADNLVKRIGIYEVPKAHITEFKVYVNKNEFKVGETVTVNVILRGVNDLGLNGDVVVILNNVQYTVKVNNGIGSFDVSGLASNTYAAFAFFNGDDNYNVPVFDNVIFKVMEPDYVISISVDDNVKVGEDATVSVSIPGASGVVKIIVDGAGTIITLDETGKAEYLIPNIAAGEHSIIAIYDGDETHNAVYNSAVLKVAKFASEVSVAGGNVVVGQDTVIKVSVTDGATGVVMIEVAGAYYSLDLSESDEISISLPVGEYSVVAKYMGDDKFDSSVSSPITVVVADKQVAHITIEAADVKVGEDATVSVSIPGATGKVTIIVDGKIAVVQLDATGSAKYVVSNVEAGNHYVTAIYNGDATHNSAYNSSVFKADKKSSEISISAGNVIVGQDIIINVDLTQGTTGFVLIKINDLYYALDITQTNELAIALPVGQYTITATYNGDEEYDSAASSPITVVVKDKTPTEIKIDADDIKVGEDATVSVSIPGASGVVKIIVDGAGTIITLDETGKAEYLIPNIAAGEHSIIAIYDGDETHNAVYNSAVLKVAKFASEVSVAGGNVVVGQDTVIKVSVTDGATGVVMIEVAGAYYSLDLSESDEISISLPVGEYSVVAKYMGDDKFDSSVSSPITVVVADKQVAHITIEAADVKVGEKAEVTITLPSDATGFVNVIVDGKDIGKLEIGENGTVKVQVTSLKAGSHTIDVVYDGDDKYEQSSSSKIITVAKLNAYFEVPYSFTRYAVDYYGGERGAKFYAILKDENGNVLANKTVQIAICGPIYTVTTDEYGRAGLTINLATANRYTYALSFQGDEDYNAAPLGSTTLILNKKTTAINVKDLSFKSTAKTKTVSVKLTTIKNEYDGKTYLNAGKKITLKVNGKTYTAKTDANGVAKFNIQITKKGTYTATVNFAGDQTYKASAKSMKITIK